MSYLRAYQLGDSIPLFISTVAANNVPTMPTSAPLARIFDASGSQVGSDISLPIIDRYALDTAGTTNCFFGLRHRLGTGYSTGRHLIVYKWVISGSTYKAVSHFDIYSGGDADGTVTAVEFFPRPDGARVHFDTESGKVNIGRNPH